MDAPSLQSRFQNVLTATSDDRAVIFLYGFIGEDYSYYYTDESLRERSITDLEFKKTLVQLEQKYDRIDIRINSIGGSVYHGNAITNAIRTSSKEIHVYNDGICASMAAAIWFSVPIERRHMADASVLMVHSVSTYGFGTAKELRATADMCDKMSYTIASSIASNTDMTADEAMKTYMDYEDHWFTSKEALEEGFIAGVEDYYAESNAHLVSSGGGENKAYYNLLGAAVAGSIPVFNNKVNSFHNTKPGNSMFTNLEQANKKILGWLDYFGKALGKTFTGSGDSPTIESVDAALKDLPTFEDVEKRITDALTQKISDAVAMANAGVAERINEAVTAALAGANAEFENKAKDLLTKIESLKASAPKDVSTEMESMRKEISDMKAALTSAPPAKGRILNTALTTTDVANAGGSVKVSGSSKY